MDKIHALIEKFSPYYTTAFTLTKYCFYSALLLFCWSVYKIDILTWSDTYLLRFFAWTNSTLAHVTYVIALLLWIRVALLRFKNEYKLSLKYLFGFFLLLYLVFDIKSMHRYTFRTIWNDYLYVDAILIPILILVAIDIVIWIGHWTKGRVKSNKDLMLSDIAISKLSEDEFEYQSDVRNYVERIQQLPLSQHSWSISITSAWGGGKTSLINLMRELMGEQDYIYINFNPRHSKSVGDIQEDFFRKLQSELKNYSSDFKSEIHNYIRALSLVDQSGAVEKALALIQDIDSSDAKSKLETSMRNLVRPVVVIMEDFDRLTRDEMLEVLKLIDGNASFPNMLFITAYDKEHVQKVFADYEYNETNYVDKYFQIEFSVPYRPYGYTKDFLKKCLNLVLSLSEEDKNAVGMLLDREQKILQHYIATPRDVKHFVNMIATEYKPVMGEVRVNDFILVKLIKYKYPEEYSRLRKKDWLDSESISGQKYWCVSALEKLDGVRSKDLIGKLFSSHRLVSDYVPYRSIREDKCFDNYFCNNVYNELKLKEIEDCLYNIDVRKYGEWTSTKDKLDDLVWHIQCKWLPDDIKTEDDLIHKIKVLIRFYSITEHETFSARLSRLINNDTVKSIADRTSLDFTKLENVLFMELRQMNTLQGLHLMNKLILDIVPNSSINKPTKAAFVAVDDLQNLRQDFFEKYLESIPVFDEVAMSELKDCTVREGILCPNCCTKARLKIIENPSAFIRDFVRVYPGVSPDGEMGTIGFEPFWKSIWESKSELKEFLFNHRFDGDENFRCTRNFYELYEANNYESLLYVGKGNLQEKVNGKLEKEVEWLRELKQYEKEIKNFDITSHLSKKVLGSQKERLVYMSNQIEQMLLPDYIIDSISEMVTKAMNDIKNFEFKSGMMS